MFQLTLVRRSLAGAAAAASLQSSATPSRRLSNANPYFTVRPRTPPTTPQAQQQAQQQQQQPKVQQNGVAPVVPTPSESRLREFKRFYETVTRSREATSLPPTPLGHGGSERILNNELLHESPWQASCVELRERAVVEEAKVLSYGNIDFASLRRQHRAGRASAQAEAYSNVDDVRPKGAPQQGPGLDVVHYYETSSSAGLAGYQRVAMQVRKGLLPGSCTNYSAEGGFAVWVVPHNEYAQAMKTMGFLTS